jgi:hypothetical protein
VVVYLHPWELDPGQPRIKDKLKSRFRHYTNLRKMESRLETLLKSYKFQSFQELIAQEEKEPFPQVASDALHLSPASTATRP